VRCPGTPRLTGHLPGAFQRARVRPLASLVATLVPALVLGLVFTTAASAGQSVSLGASFSPYRLGGRTTIGFDFHIDSPPGQIPSAVTDIDVRYPQNVGIVLSGLGVAACTPVLLDETGCPTNSIMGGGSALAELRFGEQVVTEHARLTIARAQNEEGHVALLFYAVGPSPVDTQILSPAQLVPAAAPFGGRLNIELPLVQSVPGAPDVAITQLRATIGPQGVSYEEHLDGRTIPYTPRGILLPPTCPRGGFPFAAEFTFLDGSHPTARTTIPCRGTADAPKPPAPRSSRSHTTPPARWP
jgi:hypothetical protein